MSSITNDEAIKKLTKIREYVSIAGVDARESIDLAIKAIEQNDIVVYKKCTGCGVVVDLKKAEDKLVKIKKVTDTDIEYLANTLYDNKSYAFIKNQILQFVKDHFESSKIEKWIWVSSDKMLKTSYPLTEKEAHIRCGTNWTKDESTMIEVEE